MFDPLTVFWVLAPEGTVRAVVFEVHNTFGQRHAYLLHVDDDGRAEVDKAFYVSPFNDTSGSYAIALRLTPERVSVTVGLDREGQRVMTATTTGTPLPATTGTLVATASRHLVDDLPRVAADPLARAAAVAAPPAPPTQTAPQHRGERAMTTQYQDETERAAQAGTQRQSQSGRRTTSPDARPLAPVAPGQP